MTFIKKLPEQKLCIVCDDRKRKPGSLFCGTCSKKGVFTKIKAIRDSEDYKQGWIGYGPYHYGKLAVR